MLSPLQFGAGTQVPAHLVRKVIDEQKPARALKYVQDGAERQTGSIGLSEDGDRLVVRIDGYQHPRLNAIEEDLYGHPLPAGMDTTVLRLEIDPKTGEVVNPEVHNVFYRVEKGAIPTEDIALAAHKFLLGLQEGFYQIFDLFKA